MNAKISRDLTTLEYIILAVLGAAPQSGYSIIGTLETGVHRWSASPGSIYPALKRLDQHEIIEGKLEVVHETRPRKMYRLTPLGEELLDSWLKAPLTPRELMEERDIVLIKFLFAESRLSREEVLAWLDAYDKGTEAYDKMRHAYIDLAMQVSSVHQKLIHEATIMELNMQRAWIQLARQRVTEAQQASQTSSAH